MKRGFIRCMVLLLLLTLSVPHQSIFAATNAQVKTNILNYKGQKYVQLTGGKKSVTDKINKELKSHAVTAAGLNSDIKKQNPNYSYLSSANTKYNKNEKISILVIDEMYAGGAHGLYTAHTYNYDIQTGKKIRLGDIATTKNQISNLFVSVSSGLSQLQRSGKAINEESIFGFTLTPSSLFYFYDGGIVD